MLVNTVSCVRSTLHQTAVQYGWVMMGFGLGTTLGTMTIGIFLQYRFCEADDPQTQIVTILGGGVLITASLIGANYVGLAPLI